MHKIISDIILFENRHFIVINKPQNVSVHKGTGVTNGLIDLINNNLPHCENKLKLAHRLDKGTTGCILLAKNITFLNKFHYMLRHKMVTKEYHAIVCGRPKEKFNIITEQKILNKYNKKIKNTMAVVETQCETIEYYKNYSLIKILLVTGKLHQIRIHLSAIGYPVICDTRYGNLTINKNLNTFGISNIFLHSNSILFTCPLTFKIFFIEANYNNNFKKTINFFKNEV